MSPASGGRPSSLFLTEDRGDPLLPGRQHTWAPARRVIADAVLAEQFPELVPPEPEEGWPEWLVGLAVRLRRALLAHPDGARLISTSQLSLRMAAISELAISSLVDRDVPLRQARLIVLTVEHFTVGHVLEEQTGRPTADSAQDFDMAAFVTATRPSLPGSPSTSKTTALPTICSETA